MQARFNIDLPVKIYNIEEGMGRGRTPVEPLVPHRNVKVRGSALLTSGGTKKLCKRDKFFLRRIQVFAIPTEPE